MKKIIEYNIEYARDEDQLIVSIDDAIKNGWQPIGGLAVNTHDGREYFYQAMVKYEE